MTPSFFLDIVSSVTLTSGRSAEVVSVTELAVGSKTFVDRGATFDKVGNYPNTCFFIRGPNDDKSTLPNLVQTTIETRFPSTIYLDFWGGQKHIDIVSASWIRDWNDASDAIPTTFGINGPGKVIKQNFDAGTISLMGNNGGIATWANVQGTYYAFVCPQGNLHIRLPE